MPPRFFIDRPMRHRSASLAKSRKTLNSEGRNRNVFSEKNYRREFFEGKPAGPEREDFGLRVTLNKGLSRDDGQCDSFFYRCSVI